MKNKTGAPWFSMVSNQVSSDGGETFKDIVNLNIFGEIGWDVSASEFIDTLNALGNVDLIEVEIGSVGGNVWDGLSIYNALLMHPAKIDVLVTSLAASMASVIAQAASPGNLRMMSESMQMIHNPSAGAWGDQHDHEKASKMLAKVREAMTGAYMRRFNGTEAELIALLDDETWLTADDCIANGLADESVVQDMDIAACLKNVDLNQFKNMPEGFLDIVSTPGDEEEPAPGAVEPVAVDKTDAKHNQSANVAAKEKESTMTPEEIAAAAKAAREEENKRQRDIRAAFSGHEFTGSADVLKACIDDVDVTVEMANAKILAGLGAENKPAGGPAVTVIDARDKFKAGFEEAISMKVGAKPVDHKNEYVSMSLLEACKVSAKVRGVDIAGMDKFAIVASAFQPGSDFPGLLENVLTKQVLKGYTETAEVYSTLARIGSLPDFKTASRTGLGSAPSLVENRELQEIETITLGDRKQGIQLGTYAGKTGLSRQAIINDDLNEFSQMMTKLGRAAKRTVGDQFANVFTQHAEGQLIDEGSLRIFNAARNNTGTGGVPSTASFSQLRTLMALQTDVSGNATGLNIPAKYIYCPVALEAAAQVVAQSEKEVGASTKNNTTPNVERGRWEILTDARLDANSATAYYGLADGTMFDTVEVAFLDGRDEPMIERVDSYDVLGVNWVVWIDCVAQALDFRAMAYNAGA